MILYLKKIFKLTGKYLYHIHFFLKLVNTFGKTLFVNLLQRTYIFLVKKQTKPDTLFLLLLFHFYRNLKLCAKVVIFNLLFYL